MKNSLLFIPILLVITSTLCSAQTLTLMGVTTEGGTVNKGVIFSFNIYTGAYDDLHDFGNGTDGQSPGGSLFNAGGVLYGMTKYGGTNNTANNGDGVIFDYNISTGAYGIIHDFGSGTDGQLPRGSFIMAQDSLLYAYAAWGGTYNTAQGGNGIIFNYNISTGAYTIMHDFAGFTDGVNPAGSLLQAGNGLLYGLTTAGGLNNSGTMFSIDPVTGNESTLINFWSDTNAEMPFGSLIQAGNGLLYGMLYGGSQSPYGAIFSYNILTDTDTILYNFKGEPDAGYPVASLIQVGDSLLYGMTYAGGVNNAGAIFSYNIVSGAGKILHSFGSGYDGVNPAGSLVQGTDGLLYGTTIAGGSSGNYGTIFSYNISTGVEKVVWAFNGVYGAAPHGDLIEVASPAVVNATGKLSLFPNPTPGQFTVQVLYEPDNDIVEVYNLLGQKVWQSVLSNAQNLVDLSNDDAGMYVVYLKTSQGVQTGKVMVVK